MSSERTRLSFPEAKAMHPDEWLVFGDASIDMGTGEFIDGELVWHGADQSEAYERAKQISGAKAILFAGEIPYRRVTLRKDEVGKAAA